MGTGTFPVGVAVGAQNDVTLEDVVQGSGALGMTVTLPQREYAGAGQDGYMAGSMGYPRGACSCPPVCLAREVR